MILVGQIVSLVGALAMAGVILYASIVGNFFDEGSAIVSLPCLLPPFLFSLF